MAETGDPPEAKPAIHEQRWPLDLSRRLRRPRPRAST
jgi:hypothetical protein